MTENEAKRLEYLESVEFPTPYEFDELANWFISEQYDLSGLRADFVIHSNACRARGAGLDDSLWAFCGL